MCYAKVVLKKIILFLIFTFQIFAILSQYLPNAFAVNKVECGIPGDSWAVSEVEPARGSINDTDKLIRLRIKANPGVLGEKVAILIKKDGEPYYNTAARETNNVDLPFFTDTRDNLVADVISYGNPFYYGGPITGDGMDPFPVGNYTIALAPEGSTNDNDAYCVSQNFFTVTRSDTGPDNFCTIIFDESNNYTIVTNGNDPTVRIKATFPSGSHNGVHRVRLIPKGKEQFDVNPSPNHSDLIGGPGTPGWKIPYFWVPGEYNVKLVEHNRLGVEGGSCISKESFLIETRDKGGGHLCTPDNMAGCNTTGGTIPNQQLSRPCSDANADKEDGCKRIKTAFGYVSTDQEGFTKWLLGFILSISGGIVILIIIISGYKLMTSQGDPEKVKNARDQLTAAIVGLLFIIFSLALLELITRDILGLPGFGS